MMTNPLTSKRPTNLGIHQGRLASCDKRRSSVSSQAEDKAHYIAPLEPGDRTTAQLMKRLQTALAGCEQAESELDARIETARGHLGTVQTPDAVKDEIARRCHEAAVEGVTFLLFDKRTDLPEEEDQSLLKAGRNVGPSLFMSRSMSSKYMEYAE